MQCPSCDHEAPQADYGDPLICPACGAVYAKALAARQRRETPVAPAEPLKASSGKKLGLKLLTFIGLTLVTGYLVAAPYITVYQIRQATKERNAEALGEHIDFPSVRDSLKDQLNATMMKNATKELDGNPFAAFGLALAGAMVERMVTAFVTPAGLAQMMEGEKPKAPGSRDTGVSAPSAEQVREPFEGSQMGYEGISKFVITVPDRNGGQPARFILKRSGLSWLLVDIRLPL